MKLHTGQQKLNLRQKKNGTKWIRRLQKQLIPRAAICPCDAPWWVMSHIQYMPYSTDNCQSWPKAQPNTGQRDRHIDGWKDRMTKLSAMDADSSNDRPCRHLSYMCTYTSMPADEGMLSSTHCSVSSYTHASIHTYSSIYYRYICIIHLLPICFWSEYWVEQYILLNSVPNKKLRHIPAAHKTFRWGCDFLLRQWCLISFLDLDFLLVSP